jgi:nucleotide-binding universal stress UspA family protein
MTPTMLFALAVTGLCLVAAFILFNLWGIRREKRTAVSRNEPRHTAAGAIASAREAGGPMRILLAVDGSPCSDRAVLDIARRPWPPGSLVKVLTIVHTQVPLVPEPFLTGAAAHVEALEEDRQQAPGRLERARHQLAEASGLSVSSEILEGAPAALIVDQARQWPADLVVVGSHGRGQVARLALGSVSQAVALHAPCSVEIVRCISD